VCDQGEKAVQVSLPRVFFLPPASPFADVTSRRKYAFDFFSSPPLVFPVLSVPSLFLTKTVLNGVKRSSVLQDAISFLFSFSVSIFLSVLCFHLLAVGHGEQGRFLKSCRSSG